MERRISATEARVHFGQWLRQVTERDLTLIIERRGKPEAVLLSLEGYDRLRAAGTAGEGTAALGRARSSRERIRARRQGRPVSAPEDIIAQVREERANGLADLR